MKAYVRLLTVMFVIVLLAACKQEQVKEPEVQPEPPPPAPAPEPTEVDRLDPRDFTDPRNLDNPESLLSQRIVLFDFDRSFIRPEYRDMLSAHASYASSNRTARITLEGHADERGSREYNLGLGERRGNSVREALTAQGVRDSQIEVVSYGEERPVCTQSNEDCWQRNRRVEIIYTAR